MGADKVLGCDHHRGAGVVDAGSVARGDRAAVLLERRAELRQDFNGGIRLYVLVGIEYDGFLLLLDLDRDDLVLEAAGGNCGSRALLAHQGDLVLHLAGDAILLGNVFRGDTHVVLVEYVEYAVIYHVVDHLDVVHTGAPTHVAGDVRRAGHGLRAARQDDLVVAGTDDLGGQGQGAHRGSADLVDGHRRGRKRQADADANLARQVLADACGQDFAEDYLVDDRRVNLGALDRGLSSGNAELRCRDVAEGAAVGADCGTGCGYDINVH